MALAFSEKPKRRSELTDISGVPGAEQKYTISHRNKKTALEHKGSDRRRDIITGIREVLRRPERPNSWGHNEELKREFSKVQLPSGGWGPNRGMPNR